MTTNQTGNIASGVMPYAESAETYLKEVQCNWRALVAASAGLGAGYLLNHYISNIFAPHLLDEFGWSKSEFALVGTFGLLMVLSIPVVGRMTDLLGVRRVALVGVVAFPLTFVAFSMLTGSLVQFAILTVIQNLLVGATTTSTVYSRLIAERFVSARGLALAIAATTPAIVGIIGSQLLHRCIEAHGWRAGYLAVATYVAIVGFIALVLIPSRRSKDEAESTIRRPRRRAAEDYRMIARTPAFWVISGGMLLCNLIYPLQSSQMKVMLLETGASSNMASWMISLFATGVMLGRFFCGVALDRFPAHVVATIGMALPGIGLFVVASGLNAPILLAGSVLLLGLSLGAEGDLAAYLVMRFFKVDIYSTVLGLVVTAMAVAAALGAILLSITLKLTDNFSLYMFLAGITSLTGGGLFLLLGRDSLVRSARTSVLHSAMHVTTSDRPIAVQGRNDGA